MFTFFIPSYDADAVAHYARLSAPKAGQMQALNDLVVGIKKAGLWTNLKGLCVCGTTVADTLLNIKNPTLTCSVQGGGSASINGGGSITVGSGNIGLYWDDKPDNIVSIDDGHQVLYLDSSLALSTTNEYLFGSHEFISALNNTITRFWSGSGSWDVEWFSESRITSGTGPTLNAGTVVAIYQTSTISFMNVNGVQYNGLSSGGKSSYGFLTKTGIVGRQAYLATLPLVYDYIPTPSFDTYGWWIADVTNSGYITTMKTLVDTYNTAMGIA